MNNLLTYGLAAALLAAFVAWIVWQFRRFPFRPEQTALYGLNFFIAHALWGVRVEGRFPLSENKGGVIVCNHRSSIDPSFIALCTRRAVHWMVAREYCEHPAFAWLLRTCEVIPVRRGSVDAQALRSAIGLARRGELIGMFPEGRINTTAATLLPGYAGAVRVALAAGVPIVPCYLRGSPYNGSVVGPLLMRARVHLKIGAPIDLAPYAAQIAAAEKAENEAEHPGPAATEDQAADARGSAGPIEVDPTADRPARHAPDRAVLDALTAQVLMAIARLAGDEAFEPRVAGRAAGTVKNADHAAKAGAGPSSVRD